jgi:hypothetical protein
MEASSHFDASNIERYLFPEEQQIIAGKFRGYFLTKRYNFVATINNHRDPNGGSLVVRSCEIRRASIA